MVRGAYNFRLERRIGPLSGLALETSLYIYMSPWLRFACYACDRHKPIHHVTSDKEHTFIMIRRLFYFFLVVGPLVLMGCSLVPSMMRANRMTYNDALQFTERQELLLNIVRLRYNEGPEFLATSSISTQFTIDLGASAGGTIGDEQLQRTEQH